MLSSNIMSRISHVGVLVAQASIAAALALSGCKGEQPSEAQALPSTPSETPQPATAEPPPAEPEREHELAENCDVEVLGDLEITRAALDTRDGRLTSIEVIGGHTLRISCPDAESQKDALVIVELASKDGVRSIENIVSWRLDLDPSPGKTKLRIEEGRRGVPELNEEDLALLKNEVMPGMKEWVDEGETETGEEGETGDLEAGDEAESGEVGEPGPTNSPTKAVAKVSVLFNSGRLKWAELSYENTKTKRRKKVVLDNQATRKLDPGVYALSVRYPESSQEWRDAGTVEIPAGLSTVEVLMKESPSLRGELVPPRAK